MTYRKKWKITLVALSLMVNSTLVSSANNELTILTLENAISMAQANDLWLIANKHSQDSIESMSVAAGTLPDPKVSLGIANIAADSFDFSQEAMTQFKVGVSQMFPRGESLQLKQKQLRLIGSQYPLMREDRKAKVAVTAAKLWLDIYKAQQSITLIEKDRSLFEQLTDVAQASYSSAIGKTRQQDIVRAQLELTRLDDRLTVLRQNKETSLQMLFQWISDYVSGDHATQSNPSLVSLQLNLPSELPNIAMLNTQLFTSTKQVTTERLYKFLVNHPAVRAIEQKIQASQSNIELAKQKYKPEWGVNAGYGIRDDSPAGIERSDLLTVGISFDIPLFTGNKQDKEVQSAVSNSSAIKTEKWLLVRQLTAQFKTNRAQLIRLNERQKLYQQRLLPQMHDQAEASLTAYTNDDGDFAEVVRSRIAELNASIDALAINVERQKTIVQLNYYLANSSQQIITLNNSHKATTKSSGVGK